jgi:flagellar hook-length control protein FliK
MVIMSNSAALPFFFKAQLGNQVSASNNRINTNAKLNSASIGSDNTDVQSKEKSFQSIFAIALVKNHNNTTTQINQESAIDDADMNAMGIDDVIPSEFLKQQILSAQFVEDKNSNPLSNPKNNEEELFQLIEIPKGLFQVSEDGTVTLDEKAIAEFLKDNAVLNSEEEIQFQVISLSEEEYQSIVENPSVETLNQIISDEDFENRIIPVQIDQEAKLAGQVDNPSPLTDDSTIKNQNQTLEIDDINSKRVIENNDNKQTKQSIAQSNQEKVDSIRSTTNSEIEIPVSQKQPVNNKIVENTLSNETVNNSTVVDNTSSKKSSKQEIETVSKQNNTLNEQVVTKQETETVSKQSNSLNEQVVIKQESDSKQPLDINQNNTKTQNDGIHKQSNEVQNNQTSYRQVNILQSGNGELNNIEKSDVAKLTDEQRAQLPQNFSLESRNNSQNNQKASSNISNIDSIAKTSSETDTSKAEEQKISQKQSGVSTKVDLESIGSSDIQKEKASLIDATQPKTISQDISNNTQQSIVNDSQATKLSDVEPSSNQREIKRSEVEQTISKLVVSDWEVKQSVTENSNLEKKLNSQQTQEQNINSRPLKTDNRKDIPIDTNNSDGKEESKEIDSLSKKQSSFSFSDKQSLGKNAEESLTKNESIDSSDKQPIEKNDSKVENSNIRSAETLHESTRVVNQESNQVDVDDDSSNESMKQQRADSNGFIDLDVQQNDKISVPADLDTKVSQSLKDAPNTSDNLEEPDERPQIRNKQVPQKESVTVQNEFKPNSIQSSASANQANNQSVSQSVDNDEILQSIQSETANRKTSNEKQAVLTVPEDELPKEVKEKNQKVVIVARSVAKESESDTVSNETKSEISSKKQEANPVLQSLSSKVVDSKTNSKSENNKSYKTLNQKSSSVTSENSTQNTKSTDSENRWFAETVRLNRDAVSIDMMNQVKQTPNPQPNTSSEPVQQQQPQQTQTASQQTMQNGNSQSGTQSQSMAQTSESGSSQQQYVEKIVQMQEAASQQIVKAVQGSLGSNRSHVTLRLVPKSLGTVNVQLTMNNGALTAQIATQKESTRVLLDKSISSLKSAFDEQGIKVERLVVSKESSENKSQDQDRNQSNHDRSSRFKGDQNNQSGQNNDSSFKQQYQNQRDQVWSDRLTTSDYFS